MTQSNTTDFVKSSHWAWDGDCLRHYPVEGNDHSDYWIAADKFRTAEHLAFWVLHLGRKDWVTKQDLLPVAARFQEHNCGK